MKRARSRRPISFGKKLLFSMAVAGSVILLVGVGVEVQERRQVASHGPTHTCPHPDPRVQFTLAPGDYGQMHPYFPGPESISSQGLRDEERSLGKTPGTLRLLALGDSFTFGWGVERDQVYVRVLESLLSEALPHPVEVINFGVPGYTTLQEVARLECDGLAFGPDVVLVGFNPGDLGRRLPIHGPGDFPLARLPSVAVRNYLVRTQQRRGPAVLTQGVDDEVVEANLDAVRHLAELAQEHGFTPIIAVISTADEGNTESSRVSAVADEVGIHFLDRTWILDGSATIPGDGHPNASGHRLIGERLAADLLARDLLPEPR